MDGGAEIGNSGRRGLYRADQLARAAVRALSSHLTSPVPLSIRQSWLSRARRTHSQALHPAQLRMGLAALARGERRMMPLGMLPYLLWPTRTALQARCRDRLARDLRRHLLCTVGVLYGCGTTRDRGRGAPAAGRRRSPTPARARAGARAAGIAAVAPVQYTYGTMVHYSSTSTRGQLADCDTDLKPCPEKAVWPSPQPSYAAFHKHNEHS